MSPLEKILWKIFKNGWSTRDNDEKVDFNDTIQNACIETSVQEILALIPKNIIVPQKEWEIMDNSERSHVISRNYALADVRRAMGGKDEN